MPSQRESYRLLEKNKTEESNRVLLNLKLSNWFLALNEQATNIERTISENER
ncbi:hypothetical protein [Scytonema sp. PCC 10023]|uniref:hypothetical protein n=1 Tax=Scytonema sp. PCC 10023 TaxID=1680591 RepID=UPI0039C5D0C5